MGVAGDAQSRLDEMARRVFNFAAMRTEVILGKSTSSLLKLNDAESCEDDCRVSCIMAGGCAAEYSHQGQSEQPQP